MAADLTFLAFRDETAHDELERALIVNYREELVGALVDDPGRFSHFEFGPDYPYDAVGLLLEYWYRPKPLTRGRIAHTLVTFNLPDGDYRRRWKITPSEQGRWGRWHTPWPGGRRGHWNRVARRQHVKRWLYAHEGWLLKAEAW